MTFHAGRSTLMRQPLLCIRVYGQSSA